MKHLAVNLALKHWDKTRLSYLPGNSHTTLQSIQETLAVLFPSDFREFYSATNGTEVPGWAGCDDVGWAFHRLEELSPWPNEPRIFQFADWLTGIITLGIALKEGETSMPIGGVYRLGWGMPYRIAETFSEFLCLYVRDDVSLYPQS